MQEEVATIIIIILSIAFCNKTFLGVSNLDDEECHCLH